MNSAISDLRLTCSRFCLFILGSLFSYHVAASPSLSATYYIDERGHNTTNLLYSSNNLPGNLSFWGFTDFHSGRGDNDSRSDTTSYFTEARLTHMSGKHWGVQAEYNDANGSHNNLGRLGLVYKTKINQTFLMFRAFPYETDNEGGQFSAVWRHAFLPNKLFFEGFFDYNVKESQDDRIVSEPQLRYMLTDNFGLTLEYRYNEFLKNKPFKEKGLALGFHYQF